MRVPNDQAASHDDLYSVPQSLVGEIINGDVVSHPRLSPKHARTAMALGAKLFNEFDASPSDKESNWWILNNPTTHLRDDVLVSSIAGWRKKTMPTFPDTKGFNIRPDWVCDVISPLSARYGRAAKRDIYAREGVSHLWTVDPVARTIEVFELAGSEWLLVTTVSGDQVVSLAPFDSLSLDLTLLWVG